LTMQHAFDQKQSMLAATTLTEAERRRYGATTSQDIQQVYLLIERAWRIYDWYVGVQKKNDPTEVYDFQS
jgi:hypothetical protein